LVRQVQVAHQAVQGQAAMAAIQLLAFWLPLLAAVEVGLVIQDLPHQVDQVAEALMLQAQTVLTVAQVVEQAVVLLLPLEQVRAARKAVQALLVQQRL
jgi:hypothetical protein